MDTESRGKGWAVRKGLERALRLSQHDNDLFAYIDGDLDIHPVMLKRLRKKIKDYDIVVGKKRLKNIPIMRKLITFISRIYIEKMFKIGVDTQTGTKIFKKKAITLVKRNGFLFDIAMLKIAKDKGYSLCEVLVDVCMKKNLPFSAVYNSFSESLKIK